MFRSPWLFPVPIDPFNLNHKRNIRNTPKAAYNCGGFALGTFSWYCPHNEKIDKEYGGNYYCFNEADALAITKRSVETMLSDFAGRLRVINTVTEANLQSEYVVAFRIAPNEDDFHFIRRGCQGNWYHKLGGRETIEQMDELEVFSEDWVFDSMHYNGPLVLFAVTR